MNLRGGVAAVLSTGPGIFAERSARRETRCFSYSPYSAQELLVSHTRTRSSSTQARTGYSPGFSLAFSSACRATLKMTRAITSLVGSSRSKGMMRSPVCGHEGGEVGVLRIHAQGVVKLLEEIPHHLLDSLEIQHHVIGIQRFRSEHHFHGARMAMREFAITGMFGQKMPAFQFDGFANSVDHGGRITWARVRGNPNQSLSGSHFVSYVGMGLCCSGCFWAAFPCAWPRFLADFKKNIFLPYGLSFMVFPENGGEGGA